MGERWALQAGDDENRYLYLLADDENLNPLLEAIGVEEPFSAYSRPTEGLADIVIEGNVESSTPESHTDHPYTLQIDSYCLDSSILSVNLDSDLRSLEWKNLRKQIANQPGIYAGWWHPKMKKLRLAVCEEDVNMEDLRSMLPEKNGTEGERP